MPWPTLEDVPESIRKALEELTAEQRAKWLEVANACLKDGGEEGVCIAVAWKAARGEARDAMMGNPLVVGADGKLPDWVELIRTGVWLGHPRQQQIVTPEMLRSAASYFDRHYAANSAELVIDYHHASATVPLVPRAPAAGWIDRIELRNGDTELWGHVRIWTTEAAGFITRYEYRNLSPVLRFGHPDRVTGDPVLLQIPSVALTNTPFLTELASLNENAATGGASRTQAEGGKPMRLTELLGSLLGIKPEEAAAKLGFDAGTEDKVQAEALCANADKLRQAEARTCSADVANALGVAIDADQTAGQAAVLKLKAPSGAGALAVRTSLSLAPDAADTDVLNAIGTLRELKRKTDAEEMVDRAIADGKVPPAHKDFYLREALNDLAVTGGVINSLPTIHAGGMGNRKADRKDQGLTDDQERVRKVLGVSKETMLAGVTD